MDWSKSQGLKISVFYKDIPCMNYVKEKHADDMISCNHIFNFTNISVCNLYVLQP